MYSPDPTATNAAINAGTALPRITPLFIGQGMGPNGTANTMVTDIDDGLRTTKQVLHPIMIVDRPSRGSLPFGYDIRLIECKHNSKHKHKPPVDNPGDIVADKYNISDRHIFKHLFAIRIDIWYIRDVGYFRCGFVIFVDVVVGSDIIAYI